MLLMMKAILPLFCDGLGSKDLITQLVLLPTLHPDDHHCDDDDDDKKMMMMMTKNKMMMMTILILMTPRNEK